MNPPGDADTDGSLSNCTAFFISSAYDLSRYETHTPRSPPTPHNRDSLFPCLSVSCTAFIFPCPTVPFFPFCSPPPFSFSRFVSTPPPPLYSSLSLFLSLSLRLSVCLCLSAAALNPAPSPCPFPCWFSVQSRCAPGQQWPGWETTEVTLRLGDGSLVVTDTELL